MNSKSWPLPALMVLRESAIIEHEQLGAERGYQAAMRALDAAIDRVDHLEGPDRVGWRDRFQERRVRSELYPRSGNVIPLPDPKDAA